VPEARIKHGVAFKPATRARLAGEPSDGASARWQALLAFSLPLIATSTLGPLSASANGIFVGRLLGARALAAVSLFIPILILLISFFGGVASGTSILVGQAFGAKDVEKARAYTGNAVTLAILMGVTLALVGPVAVQPLLAALNAPPEVAGSGRAFAQAILFGAPIIFAFVVFTTAIRGVGDSKTPLYATIASTALGVVLAPLCIAGWGPIPAGGVVGAAIALIGSDAGGLLFTVTWLHVHQHPLRIDRAFLRAMIPSASLTGDTLRIGVPTGIESILISLSEVAVVAFVNAFGFRATAAYGVLEQVLAYVALPAVSVATAASIMNAQLFGAHRYGDAGALTRDALLMGLALIVVAMALSLVLARPIVGLFVTDPQTIAIALHSLWIVVLGYPFFTATQVLSGMMRATGSVLWPVVISIATIWGVQVPIAWLASRGMGLDAIWISYPVGYAAALLLTVIYFSIWWRQRVVPATP
jgi:putative MATE family efflux protein